MILKKTTTKINFLTDNKYVVECFTPGPIQEQSGGQTSHSVDLPLTTTVIELHNYLNSILENTESLPYNFYFNSIEIKKSLNEFIKKLENFSSEKVFPITYHPQALFFVRPIILDLGS